MKKTIFNDFIFIILGSMILALGINVFSAPNKLSAGGINSIGTVLLYLFKIRLSVTNIVCNLILFFWGYKSLGKYAVVKTASGILFLSLFLELTSHIPVYTGDIIIASITGGMLMGIGVGFVVRQGASTGGSDFAGLLLHKLLPHIPLAYLIMFIDCAIVVVAGFIFKSVSVTFYSVLSLVISSKFTDMIITFGDSAKSVQIISEKSTEIAEMVMQQLDRGVTGIHCRGMYSGNDSLMLLCVIDNKALPQLVNIVRDVDNSAFVVINSSKEVLGNGFKE